MTTLTQSSGQLDCIFESRTSSWKPMAIHVLNQGTLDPSSFELYRLKHHYGTGAVDRLKSLLATLEFMRPSRITESDDGDQDAYFIGERRFVKVGVDEDGDATIMFSDRAQGLVEIEEVVGDISGFESRMRGFLAGGQRS